MKLSKEEFIRKIRDKYPESYKDLSDDELLEKILQKYPHYQNEINFVKSKRGIRTIIKYSSISILILLVILFIIGSFSDTNDMSEADTIEEDVLTKIRQDGYIFQYNVYCGDDADFKGWNVKGIWLSKDSLIEIYIRNSYEYKTNPQHTGKVNFQELKKIYPEMFENISSSINGYYNYTKFGLLFYEGRYKCEDGINVQKDTIPVMFTHNYDRIKYVSLGLVPGP